MTDDDYRDNRPECARKGDRFCKENCRYSATCSVVAVAGYCWAHMDCTTCEYTKDCAAFHHRGENWEDFGRIERCEAENAELESLRSIVDNLMAAKGLLSRTKEPTRRDNYNACLLMNDALGKARRLMHDIEIRRNAPAGRKLDLSCSRFTLALMSILEDVYGHLKGNVFGSAKKARALVGEALGNIRNLDAYSIRDDENGVIILAPEGIGREKLEELLSGAEEKSLEERVRELERLTDILKEKTETVEEECMFENEKVENDDAGATVFLHKLAIALIQTGAGTGIIKDEVADFIRRCYISGIEFDVSIKEDITNGKEKED